MRWHKYKKRKRNKKSVFIKILVIALLIPVLCFFYFELNLRPKVDDITKIKAQDLATEAINKAVENVLEKQEITYEDLMNITYNETTKQIVGITSNVIQVNKLKSAISLSALKEIDNLSQTEIEFRAGDLSDFSLFSARGPQIIVKLSFTSSIVTDVISSFESAGMNQTRHVVQIEIKGNVYITSQSIDDAILTVATKIPVAENIIVGSVPSLYTGNLLSAAQSN